MQEATDFVSGKGKRLKEEEVRQTAVLFVARTDRQFGPKSRTVLSFLFSRRIIKTQPVSDAKLSSPLAHSHRHSM